MRKVQLFIPQLVDQFFPKSALNTVRLLERVGYSVSYNASNVLSGLDAYEAGDFDKAKTIGTTFLQSLSEEDYIVSPSFSSIGMIKYGFNDLFTNSTEHNKCRAIQRNSYTITDFLIQVAKREYYGAEFVTSAVFHSACSIWGDYNIHDASLKLLQQVGGLDLVLSTESCCKVGRSIISPLSEVSLSIAHRFVQLALDTKAEYIICNDFDCLMNLQSVIDRKNLPIKPIHIVDVLTSGWPNI